MLRPRTALVLALLARTARAEEPEDVRAYEDGAGGFSSTISAKNSPREATDAAALVENGPGVHVRRLGGDDGFATISIRGSTANQVNFVFAGVPLSGAGDPTVDLSSLPLFATTSMRVYRTFVPAALGPSSLGGTVAIDPVRSRGTETETMLGAGSFGSTKARLLLSAPLSEKERFSFALSGSRSDGDFSFYNDVLGVFRPRENNAHAKFGSFVSYQRTEPLGKERSLLFRSSTFVDGRRQELPGTVTFPTPNDRIRSSRLIHVLELDNVGHEWSYGLTAWGRRSELDTLNGISAFSRSAQDTDDLFLALGAIGRVKGRWETFRFDGRVDLIQEGYEPQKYIGAAPPQNSSRTLLGIGSDVRWEIVETLTASASAQLQGTFDATGNATSHDLLPTAHLGAEYTYKGFAWSAHGGFLSRPPGFTERFGNAGAFLGNPALTRESAWSGDLGMRTRHAIGALKLHTELVAFLVSARDLITFVPFDRDRFRTTNIGFARMIGGELSGEAKLKPWMIRASYTLLHSETDATSCANAPGCEPPPLPGRPIHDLAIDTGFEWPLFRVNYGFDFVSGIRADTSGTIVVPPRALQSIEIRAKLPWEKRLSVSASVRNLFDERTVIYAGALKALEKPIGDAYDYPLPGRNLFVSVRFQESRQ